MSCAPLFPGLFKGSLEDLRSLRLRGAHCEECGETSFGTGARCPNCGGERLAETALSRRGVLHTYTIVRNPSPGAHVDYTSFQPYGIGLVELPDGVRIMAPLRAEIDELKIGMELALEAFVVRTDEEGCAMVGFAFAKEA